MRTSLVWSIGIIAMSAVGWRTVSAQAIPAESESWNAHVQTTVVEQWRGDIRSPYVGANSLQPSGEDKHTVTLTAFLGYRVWPGAELYYNPEMSQGTGLSETVGAAGFPNGEATRAGAKTPQYNTARLFLRQTVGLGGAGEKIESDQNQLAGSRDEERLVFTLGKLSAADVFDGNRYSHDPRTQFLNWALMDNGAWDYPADTKGYTNGVTIEWNRKSSALRWGALMEPAAANESKLDWHLAKALGQVIEWEERYAVGGHAGALRGLVYWNRAHMGNYQEATAMARPDVTLTRAYRSKAGAGVNWEQEMSDDAGAFARAGFNDGRNETWAFTEIDRSVSVGVSVRGRRWGRADDTVGVAVLGNGLSREHRDYLAAGGLGFIVGDGRLHYATEQIAETYYDYQATRWLAFAFDLQRVEHPAYNRDRGPATVFAVRGHVAL